MTPASLGRLVTFVLPQGVMRRHGRVVEVHTSGLAVRVEMHRRELPVAVRLDPKTVCLWPENAPLP
jgi:ribosomal protein L35AE/L33A